MTTDFDTSSIRDREDLLAFAIALEERSAQRYDRLAVAVRQSGRADLAALFDGLSKGAYHHRERLQQRWGSGPSPRQSEAVLAAGSDLQKPEALEELIPHSSYRCLTDAVRREQAAFTRFSYIAAESDDPEVTSLAEALAQEKLQQAAQLRVHRRRAYHQEPQPASPWPSAKQVNTLKDLLEAAEAGERRFLETLSSSGESLFVLSELERMAETILLRIGLPAEQRPPPSGAPSRSEPAGQQEPKGSRPLTLREAHAAFDFYDTVAGTAQHEDIMEAAQQLSAFALERIQLLHALDA